MRRRSIAVRQKRSRSSGDVCGWRSGRNRRVRAAAGSECRQYRDHIRSRGMEGFHVRSQICASPCQARSRACNLNESRSQLTRNCVSIRTRHSPRATVSARCSSATALSGSSSLMLYDDDPVDDTSSPIRSIRCTPSSFVSLDQAPPFLWLAKVANARRPASEVGQAEIETRCRG